MSRTKVRVAIGLAAVMFGVGLAVPAQASTTVAPVTNQTGVVTGDWRGGGDWGGGGDWWGGHRNRCWFWWHGQWRFNWDNWWCRHHGGGHWGGPGPWGPWGGRVHR
jgi:hypothetical protein